MTQEAFERGDWQAVIDAHRLESHDAAEWLLYGDALLQSIEPVPEAGKQQPAAAVAASQRQAVMSSLRQVLQLVGILGPKKLPCGHGGLIREVPRSAAKRSPPAEWAGSRAARMALHQPAPHDLQPFRRLRQPACSANQTPRSAGR